MDHEKEMELDAWDSSPIPLFMGGNLNQSFDFNNPYEPLKVSFSNMQVDSPPDNFAIDNDNNGDDDNEEIGVPEHVELSMKSVFDAQQNQENQLGNLRGKMKDLLKNPQQSQCVQLQSTLKSMRQSIKKETALLRELFSMNLFSCEEIHAIYDCRDKLSIQDEIADLMLHELTSFMNGKEIPEPPAKLLIIQQPFPRVYTKGKSVEDNELQCRLITCVGVQAKPVGAAYANFGNAVQSNAKKKVEPLQNNTGNINRNNVVVFNPKFCAGTRRNVVNMEFSVKMNVGGRQGVITSKPAKDVVVITNECQWAGSEGALLQNTIFDNDDYDQVSWAMFSNILVYHFVVTTRQTPLMPSRSLSRKEIEYIHQQHFNGDNMISGNEFGDFWKWYGACVQVLRYQRHIAPLWNAGLVCGFLSRDGVTQALKGREPGTFLIRFSERHAGQFAIAYVGLEIPRRVKHYLVQPADTASAKKTLPDFLAQCHQFQFILELSVAPNGSPQFTSVKKDDAFELFYSKRKNIVDPGPGYDPLTNQL